MSTLKIPSKYLLYILFIFSNIIISKTIYVNNTIQLKNALNNALPYDTIKINKENYQFNFLEIKKPLTLVGINSPTFDGNNKGTILIVKSNYVFIEGINFQNTGYSFTNDFSAIKIDGANNCSILKNNFTNCFFAIYLAKSFNCSISKNKIVGSQKRQTFSGNGIHLWYSKNIYISNNFIEGQRDGIYLEFTNKSTIEKNISKNNLRYGLHFMFSDSCNYSENIFEKNNAGVAVMYTNNVKMYGNIFRNNWGDASYGLLLKDISSSEIKNNYFIKNTAGIYLEGCDRNSFKNNQFKNNGWAIRLMANSMENTFIKNIFLGNTFDVTTNNSKNYNTFDKNYWSDYNGYDIDKDGYGDTPYRPVKLISILVENNKTLLILLRSFFVELLNLAEKLLPVLTPETLIDNHPLMKVNI